METVRRAKKASQEKMTLGWEVGLRLGDAVTGTERGVTKKIPAAGGVLSASAASTGATTTSAQGSDVSGRKPDGTAETSAMVGRVSSPGIVATPPNVCILTSCRGFTD